MSDESSVCPLRAREAERGRQVQGQDRARQAGAGMSDARATVLARLHAARDEAQAAARRWGDPELYGHDPAQAQEYAEQARWLDVAIGAVAQEVR